MMNFFSENLSTIVGSLIVLGVLALNVRHLVRAHQKGGCCGCSGCGGACGHCHSDGAKQCSQC
ncbi:MAG: hypothetical protein SOZ52_07240 [Pyramidobacter sp.]|nr:hypothetical protein [Pyramidobacter sp.]